MNAVQLIGRLTKDPEIRTTQNGIKCGTFTLAVDRPRANKDGNREADFLPCVCWRGTAEFAEKWLTKGMKIAVLGSIQTRSYEKDGAKRFVTEILCDHLEFVESKATEPAKNEGFTEVDSDDLPFDLGGRKVVI